MNSTDTVLTQYLNLSLMKTVFISYQNETRKEENVSYFCVLYSNDYVFDFNLCFIFACLVDVVRCITSCHNDCNCSTGGEIASHQYTTNNLLHAGFFKIIY